jgi:hypothetical protein
LKSKSGKSQANNGERGVRQRQGEFCRGGIFEFATQSTRKPTCFAIFAIVAREHPVTLWIVLQLCPSKSGPACRVATPYD